MKKLLIAFAALLLVAPAVRADDEKPAEEKADKAEPAEKAESAEKAEKAEKGEKHEAKSGGGEHAYVDTAIKFLNALAKSARKGEKGAQGWADLQETAGDKVNISVAGKDHVVDVAGKKSDVRLMKYAKIATWREGKTVKGVTAEVLEFRSGKENHSGKGKVAMEEKDGKWTVTGVTVE